jgi:hypothetical protein
LVDIKVGKELTLTVQPLTPEQRAELIKNIRSPLVAMIEEHHRAQIPLDDRSCCASECCRRAISNLKSEIHKSVLIRSLILLSTFLLITIPCLARQLT